MDATEETARPIVFKKKSRPSGLSHKRKTLDTSGDNEDNKETKDEKREKNEEQEDEEDKNIDWQTLDNLKEFQKLKRKVNRGINVDDLISMKTTDVSKLKKTTSGLKDATAVASDLDLGNTFSVETNRRDEDAEMAKFIESELAKRKGLQSSEDDQSSDKLKVMKSVDELVFNVLPNDLLQPSSSKQQNEEMLSAQMLLGIPEVNLGIDERVRNLEETEKATKKLLARQLSSSRNKSVPDLTPSNMTVDFNQRPKKNKNIEGNNRTEQANKSSVTVVQEPVVVIGDEPREASFKSYTAGERQLKHPGQQKASDDYHFERFRKQFKKK